MIGVKERKVRTCGWPNDMGERMTDNKIINKKKKKTTTCRQTQPFILHSKPLTKDSATCSLPKNPRVYSSS